jgi:hypothetical protein
MLCGCCGERAELDLQSGVRVLSSNKTQDHFVCTNLRKFVHDFKKKIPRELYFMTDICDMLEKHILQTPYKK